MLGLLGALDPYKHKLNQTGGVLVDGDSAAISKDMTDSEAGKIFFIFHYTVGQRGAKKMIFQLALR